MNPLRLETLEAIEAAIWRELGLAVRDKGHGWRVGVLATTDGALAEARSVVLREWDEAERTLVIFTDARSAKVAQIAAHPLGALVLWSSALGWQLRLRVAMSLATDGLAVSSRWARLKMTPAAQDYLSPLPPGSPLAEVAEEVDSGAVPAAALSAPPVRESRSFFAVLSARIESVDWLELHPLGHRRAGFQGGPGGEIRWLTP